MVTNTNLASLVCFTAVPYKINLFMFYACDIKINILL